MPPKIKVLKEDIVKVAFEIVRTQGADALNARNLATELNCSTQPIFSNFATMDMLKNEVITKAIEYFNTYREREIKRNVYPIYKANGMAYISFAKEEKELFKLLYMRDRSDEDTCQEASLYTEMTDLVHDTVGLNIDRAKLFHLEIWTYVHGIATMFATCYLDLDTELVSKMITDVYQGLKKQYETEETNGRDKN